jgi:two-component system, NarL family, sensor kinase
VLLHAAYLFFTANHPPMEKVIQTIVITAFLTLLIGFTLYMMFRYQQKQTRHLLERQQMLAQYKEELLRTQLEIQEYTFKNISEEIHDNIGQTLSLVKLNLGTIRSIEDQRLADSRDLLSKAIADLRTLSHGLLGEKVAETGLAAAIENELKLLQNSARFKISFHLTGQSVPTTPQKEMLLFRIVQEALHNAIKHSGGSEVSISLDYEPQHLLLTIRDNGKGFDSASLDPLKTGIGMKNMKNRAALAGATMRIESGMGKGTCLRLVIPLDIAAAAR